VPRPRYTDKYDDPLYDSFDDRYGDYDADELADGFSIVSFDDPEGDEDDDY
jgi:hypothetical protein